MGYYLGVSYMQPRGAIGAQGGFFGGIMPFIRNLGQAAVTAWNPAVGAVVAGVRGAMQHPVVTGAAAAATGTAVAAGIAHHYGGAATAAAPGAIQVHGHLHVGGRGRRAAPAVPGMRRHRRMNVCNVRALRRAIRRAHGFERVARKVISFPFHKHAAKKGVFKRTRKAK